MNRKKDRTILAWSLSVMIAVPLAALVGGFAGWAVGAAAGEWLEDAGVNDALFWGGRIGGVLAARGKSRFGPCFCFAWR
jgi:hypothetical protein